MNLGLVLPILRFVTSPRRAKATLARIVAVLVLLTAAMMFALVALAFGLAAGHTYLATVVSPPAAAGLMAAAALLLSLLLVVAALRWPRRRQAESTGIADRLTTWARSNPWEAAAAAFALGIALGSRRQSSPP